MTFSNDMATGLPLALWLMLIVIALAVSITIWAVRQVFENRRRSEILKVQAELQLRLLDKVSSSDELRGFLESPAVRSLLENDAQAARTEPQDRIFGCLVPGCILTPAGVAMLLIGQGTARFLGSLTLATGLGFLVAATVAWRLTRSMGLIDQRAEKDSARKRE
jgi:hypothetical protein